MGARMERLWISDPDTEGADYIVNVSRDGSHVGWVTGKCRMIMELFSDQSYARNIGEDEDTLMIFVLTDLGPVPVTVSATPYPNDGLVGYTLGWRLPGVRGKAGYRYETGAHTVIDF